MLRDKLGNDDEKPYEPKEGDKIDFMNSKSKAFIPAIIKKIRQGEEEGQVLTISYFVSNNEYIKEEVNYPDPK